MNELGLEIKVAENGKQCIDIFQQWQPDLIWMDRRMPVLDGVEATRRIRSLPGGDKVKIIAVTASVLSEQRQELGRAGMDDFVNKPYRFEELYDCMAQHLGLHYLYAEDVSAPRPTQPLTPAMLATVDPELRGRLRLALESLHSSHIFDAITQVGVTNPELAVILSRMVDEFDYPTVLDALNQTKP
jgi:CheY-like chemotaxis protein